MAFLGRARCPLWPTDAEGARPTGHFGPARRGPGKPSRHPFDVYLRVRHDHAERGNAGAQACGIERGMGVVNRAF